MSTQRVSDDPQLYLGDESRKDLFDLLVHIWSQETQYISSVSEKWSHFAYQCIIEMGEPAIPLILEQVELGGRLWTRALASISGENPAEDTQTHEEARDAWVNWGKERGWLRP